MLVVGTFLAGGLVAFPVTILIAATAAAFGPWFGFLYATLGVLASALAIYALGAQFGQAALRRLMGPRLDRIRARIARQGVLAVAAVRIVPVAPFTFVNLALGASAIKLVDYLAGTLLGMLPGLIVMSALGHRIVAIVSQPSLVEVVAAGACGGWLDRGVARRAGAGVADGEPGVLSATVRLMTWNIHGAVGRNPRFDLARVVELIQRHAPDIVALQEINSRRGREAAATRSPCCSRRSAATASARKPSSPPTASTARRCSAAGRCAIARSATSRIRSASRAAPSAARSRRRPVRCASSPPIWG